MLGRKGLNRAPVLCKLSVLHAVDVHHQNLGLAGICAPIAVNRHHIAVYNHMSNVYMELRKALEYLLKIIVESGTADKLTNISIILARTSNATHLARC